MTLTWRVICLNLLSGATLLGLTTKKETSRPSVPGSAHLQGSRRSYKGQGSLCTPRREKRRTGALVPEASDTQECRSLAPRPATTLGRPHWALRPHDVTFANVAEKLQPAREGLPGTFLLPNFVPVCKDLGKGGRVDGIRGDTEALRSSLAFLSHDLGLGGHRGPT